MRTTDVTHTASRARHYIHAHISSTSYPQFWCTRYPWEVPPRRTLTRSLSSASAKAGAWGQLTWHPRAACRWVRHSCGEGGGGGARGSGPRRAAPATSARPRPGVAAGAAADGTAAVGAGVSEKHVQRDS